MKNCKHRFGKAGEDIAYNYLKELGYCFIDRNYHTRNGELDLIFMDGDILVFIEVKTRQSNNLVPLDESIDDRKVKRILNCAETYIDTHRLEFRETRIDSVLILWEGNRWKIEHRKNIY